MVQRPWISLASILAAAGAMGFGPRVRVGTIPHRATPPSDLKVLTDWVCDRERATPGVVTGAEAQVTFHDGVRQTDAAVVYLHGFSATRQETAPLAEHIAQALQANLFESRLTGHGQGSAALGASLASDWIADARQAIQVGRRLGKRVVLLGVSTGGTLLAALASELLASDIVVMVSPNFGPKNAAAELVLWPWAKWTLPPVFGAERAFEPTNEAHGIYWTTRYPISAIFQMMALVEYARRADVSTYNGSLLVVHAPADPVVAQQYSKNAFARFQSARDPVFREPQVAGEAHVIAGDILAPNQTEEISGMIVGYVRERLGPGF